MNQDTISYQLAPAYRSDVTRIIGILQQLQRLCTYDASLNEVIAVLQDLRCEFGDDCQLESIIQRLVGQQLAPQLAARRASKAEVLP
jgi:hypothetical protein